jgi:probable phosphoglycerate mutase
MAGTIKELWMVRHGETTYGAEQRIAGWADPPLSSRGEREAAALREVLADTSFESVWSSDLRRTIATANLAWGEARPDQRLREICFGDIEGASYETFRTDQGRSLLEFRTFAAPGGESVEDVRLRVEEMVDELPEGRHLLFVHGGVIRVLTQDIGLDRFVATGSLVALDWTARRLLFVHEPADASRVPELVDDEASAS